MSPIYTPSEPVRWATERLVNAMREDGERIFDVRQIPMQLPEPEVHDDPVSR